ncbi:molybdopterin-guanine dinucleotide biosynthesis protein B [Coralliovum pocilloporae]|uniref:molybdopterin-guanine dinucleotide biosynthesis protein B n=1 Tax=Coralliovum pocilloporae TaxID=3066369 RepID=UPI003307C269
MASAPVFGVTGWKNSGKTTLVTRLITELTERGYRVASVKHAHHTIDIDTPGTDSYRHRQAGAQEVALVAGSRWAIMHELAGEPEPSLETIISRLGPSDIVMVEGFKREGHMKIEARRTESKKRVPLAPDDPQIVAIAADHEVENADRPVYDLDDIPGLADLIISKCGLER